MTRFASIGMLPPAMREQAEARLKDQTRTVRLLGESEKPGRKHANGPRMKAVTTIVRPPGDKGRDPTGALLWQIKGLKLPEPEREHRFHPTRGWRFDLAWPAQKIALEIEGVTHDGGRHQRVKGYTEDCRKYLAALLAGWRVVRLTPDMIRKGDGGRALAELLKTLRKEAG